MLCLIVREKVLSFIIYGKVEKRKLKENSLMDGLMIEKCKMSHNFLVAYHH
jgi:hypothetical protein